VQGCAPGKESVLEFISEDVREVLGGMRMGEGSIEMKCSDITPCFIGRLLWKPLLQLLCCCDAIGVSYKVFPIRCFLQGIYYHLKTVVAFYRIIREY